MVSYPVHAPFDNYRGREPHRRKKAENHNHVAALVANYLNAEVATWEVDTASAIMSFQVASEIGADSDLVHLIFSQIGGGSCGVTILKGNYERAMAR